MDIDPKDLELLARDKYAGDPSQITDEDRARLAAGEPLAYVIGWIPFLGLRIRLDSRPLIPRPETEWWAEELVRHLEDHFGDSPVRLLDLCAGSGAIGLSVLAKLPQAQVSFGELAPEHAEQIRANLLENGIDPVRADVRAGDLFEPFRGESFDVIVANPPYVPEGRALEPGVVSFEPSEALFAGPDGLVLIRRIADEALAHLTRPGELWIECDIANAEEAEQLFLRQGVEYTELRTDLYGRPRLVVAHYS